MSLTEELLSLMFPDGLLDYFEIKRIGKIQVGYQIYLEEKKDVPSEYADQGYICHGFYDEQVIHDFPLRGKAFDLIVKRRRWLHPQSHKVVSRNWNLIASGTSLSQEFADFLKGIHR